MYNNNNINYSIIAMFMVLFSINGWVQLSNQCAKAVSIILGGVIGMLMGYTIVTFLDTIDKNMRALLYFNTTELVIFFLLVKLFCMYVFNILMFCLSDAFNFQKSYCR